MLTVAVGHSELVDVEDIIEEISDQCEDQLEGQVPQAGLLFAAVDMDYRGLLTAIQTRWPGLRLIGCTTDGEMSSQLGFAEDSVSLTLFASDAVEITVGVGRTASRDVVAAANEAYAQARGAATLAPALCIVTPASLTFSSEQAVKAVKSVIGPDVPLFGAVAGDQWRFEQTYQFFDGDVLTDAIPLILFSGPIHVASGTQSGWRTIGPIGTITKADGNVVYSIDGHSALAFYKDLLGDQAVPTGDRPLAILDEDGNISRLRASNEAFDPDSGAVTFFGEFSEGDQVQITVADRNEILDGTRASVRAAKRSFPAGRTPEAALFFSCSARKLLLGTRTQEEYKILREEIGEGVPIFGFYGYGEIGPSLSGDALCEFHNETFVTVLIRSD
jgi:hypothetical protein